MPEKDIRKSLLITVTKRLDQEKGEVFKSKMSRDQNRHALKRLKAEPAASKNSEPLKRIF